ncbi:MAG: hypothetical protein Q8K70_11170 [Bacteroidota bacterium]|nr:hypothetical protein [Bacteroidota bacterium]
MADDIASSDGKIIKTGGTILPSGAVIVFRDSLYTDSSGIDFYIDFGPLGTTAPYGMLCEDGRYRAGKLNITVSQPYKSIGTVIMVNIADEDSFHVGNSIDMYQLMGNKKITKTSEKNMDIEVSNANLKSKKGGKFSHEIAWGCIGTIERTHDEGPGIWKDQFRITGTSNGTNRNGEKFTVTIDSPLLKKVEPGCHHTFVLGIQTLTNTVSNQKITIDYDPNKDGACDESAEANINGKKTIFEVK